ncbi:MAG TPA: hypothetical protein VK578_07840 [Edaphobacter sp.]|nr:hypothetical protein [Edaphobacter sp.]
MKFHNEVFGGVLLTMLGGVLSMTATAQQPASAAGTGSVSGACDLRGHAAASEVCTCGIVRGSG